MSKTEKETKKPFFVKRLEGKSFVVKTNIKAGARLERPKGDNEPDPGP